MRRTGESKAPTLTPQSRGSALGSVGFWSALVVLITNDHWLKGSGLLPGWLTGKLSDFTGLFVAPVLLATLLRARRTATILACLAVVATPFSLIKVVPPFARAVERVTHVIALDWRLWSDPTDLLALVVLPLAWAALRAQTPTNSGRMPRWWVERLGGVAAALVCVATSAYDRHLTTAVAIVNVTHDSVPLQVFRPSQPLDCEAAVVDPRAFLSANDFSFEACHELEPFEAVALDVDWSGEGPDGQPHTPPPDAARICDAVLLRAEGLDDTIVFWNDVPQAELVEVAGPPKDEAHLVYLERVGERLVVARPDVATAWAAGFRLPSARCNGGAP